VWDPRWTVPAVIVSDISCDAWPKVLQIGSAVFVRLLLSSNIDDEGRRCAAGRESQIPLRDATVFGRRPGVCFSNDLLRDSVLPWTPDACANRFYAACLQELDDITAEFGIPVQYNVALGTGQGERLSQLLYDPLARRVRRGVEVQNTAAAVLLPFPASPVSVTRSSQATESAAQSSTVGRGGAVWDGFVSA
jgi:hypothetical protein